QEKLSKEEKARREKNIQAGNPFAKYGYKAKVATLSKGKYLEFHDLDSIVTIGTSRWHVDNKKIVGDIVMDSLNVDAQPIGDAPGMWMSPDPLSEEFPDYSPYNFCFNNPVKFVDPDGRAAGPPSTDVTVNKDGTYTVVNSKADGKRTGETIGKTVSEYSFIKDDNKTPAVGATINLNDNSGKNFLSKIITNTPNVVEGAAKLLPNNSLDFKRVGMGNQDLQMFAYRGMPLGKDLIGTGRDVGNITAGIVAGRSGFSFSEAKPFFEALQGGIEPKVTTSAEKIGISIGLKLHTQDYAKIFRQNLQEAKEIIQQEKK
ncbi:hypothetical protein AAIP42_002648, partial [Flavobacterium psychrophilum]|nr:hypothetical protein [Flavobacterium psychrophilum]